MAIQHCLEIKKQRYHYDAIIIGTGIGGAAIGALLAHAGWKILILEKNKIVGGRCTTYKRYGFKVDLGWHNFCLGDKGPHEDICRQVGMPNAIEWLSTVNKGRLQIGDEVMDYNRKTMINVLPENERDNMRKLFASAMQLSNQELDKLYYVPLAKWVDTFTKNRLAHTLIDSLVSQYFCVPSSVASAAEFIKCFRDVVTYRGMAYPKGGNITVPKTYITAIEKYGGEVRLNAKVKKVIIKDKTAVGVRLDDSSEFRAPVIISNAGIKATVADLVGEEHFPNDYVQRIQKLTYAVLPVLMKVILKERITDDVIIIYLPDENSPTLKVTEEMWYGKIPEWVAGLIFSPTNLDPSPGPPEKQLITFFSVCPPNQDWNEWEKVLLNNFYRVYPQAKGKVWKHFLETYELVDGFAGEIGNIIGVGQTVDQVHERRPSVTSPIKGLYYCCADVGSHGIGTELAANSAKELFAILISQ